MQPPDSLLGGDNLALQLDRGRVLDDTSCEWVDQFEDRL